MQNEIRRRSVQAEESGLTSYCLIMPYVWSGSLHLRAIFSSNVFPWMDSCGTALGTGHKSETQNRSESADQTWIDLKRLKCFKSIFSCIQYVMLKWTASKHEKDYSSIQSKTQGLLAVPWPLLTCSCFSFQCSSSNMLFKHTLLSGEITHT